MDGVSRRDSFNTSVISEARNAGSVLAFDANAAQS